VSQLLVEVLKNDKLRKLEKEKKTYAERCVLSAARLIAPVIENTFSDGYSWVTESIKSSRHAALAHALEVSWNALQGFEVLPCAHACVISYCFHGVVRTGKSKQID